MNRLCCVRLAVVLCTMASLAFAPSLVVAQWDCEDQVAAWAVNDTIFVEHNGALYNCCGIIVIDMETPEQFLVEFLETETFEGPPCACMCCFNLDMWGFGFGAGHYTIRVWNFDRTELYGETEVDVYEDLLTPVGFGGYLQSDCLENSSTPDDNTGTTWGRIKSVYE